MAHIRQSRPDNGLGFRSGGLEEGGGVCIHVVWAVARMSMGIIGEHEHEHCCGEHAHVH